MNHRTDVKPEQLHAFRQAIVPVLLFIAAVGLYAHSVRYDFIYDDHKLIVDPPALQSVGEVLQVFAEGHWEGLPYYRPLARLTMVIQQVLQGDNPAAYHGWVCLRCSCGGCSDNLRLELVLGQR